MPRKKCASRSCGIMSLSMTAKDNNLVFYPFPDNPDRLSSWLEYCGVISVEKIPKYQRFICSRHFEHCLVPMPSFIDGVRGVQYILPPDAVPQNTHPLGLSRQEPGPSTSTTSASTDQSESDNPAGPSNGSPKQQHLSGSGSFANDQEPCTSGFSDDLMTTPKSRKRVSHSMTSISGRRRPGKPDFQSEIRLKSKNEGLSRKVKKLNDQVRRQKHRIAVLTRSVSESRKIRNSSRPPFLTDLQHRVLLSSKRVRRWDVDSMRKAIVYRSLGKRLYEQLRKDGFPLPDERSIRRFTSAVSVKPGILECSFDSLVNRNLEPWQKVTVIGFDEMSIDRRVQYDQV